ncbi:cytochrome P450 [Hyphomonas sp.]|uniref:cytochrome P450 n=1 Tax=Hyphomonas sp. TaxID=87 RepID=UPI00391D6803
MTRELTGDARLFEPPAPRPGNLPPFLQGLATFRSQIEGLPAAVFEADAWQPPFPGMPLFIMSSEAIRRVLLTDAHAFPSGELFARMMRPVWGDGLLLAPPGSWKVQRRATAEAFRPAAVDALTPFFVAAAQQKLARWRALPEGQRVDIFEEMKRLTFDVILDTMLSGAGTFDRDAFARSAEAFFADISRIRLSYILKPDAWHAERPPVQSKHRVVLITHIRRLIAARRGAPARGDLVDLLLQARDPETGDALSDALLCDNLLGFIMAGYETTSTALTWTLYLIAAHAPTQARLIDEANNVLGADDVTPDALPALSFARAVISEAMRLYPPAFLLTRVSAQDTELAGRPVRAGQRVNIPVYALHRRAAAWPNPHAFDPSRFLPGSASPDRFAYLPFGAGPRICIGAAFAMSEMIALLVTLLRGAAFSFPPDTRVWPQTGLALYPRHGLSLQIRRR